MPPIINLLFRWSAVACDWLHLSRASVCFAAAILLAVTQSAPAQTTLAALPSGPQTVQGNVRFVQSGTHLQVSNSPGAIIDWKSFNIAAGHSTYFQQQSASSSVLNRVVTNNPSQIFGTLGSNGRVILVNPSGIVVGAGAVVDSAGFIASTLGLVESDATLSRLRFGANSPSVGRLQVDGIIRSTQGDIVLMAPDARVGPAAFIKASDGAVMLAAGQQVLLTGRGLDGISLQLQAPTDQAINLGRLEGSAVGMFGSLLRNVGVIQATSAEIVGGRIMLRASASANVSGTVTAAGSGANSLGGVVTVEGREVFLESANISASGTAGGGVVLVGGGWQGKDGSISNSQNTTVDTASRINVSGVGNAKGGTAVVWSDGNTLFSGHIEARGGADGGDGGRVEVSGKQNLAFDGDVRANAPKGIGGSILLDPKNINIQLTGSNVTDSVTFGQFGTTTQTFFNNSLQTLVSSLAGSTLTIQATNDINVDAPLTFTGLAGNLNFEAGRSVNINGSINFPTGNSANLTITANSADTDPSSPFRDPGLGGINVAAGNSINLEGGGTLRLIVANGAGGGGAIKLGNTSNMDRLIAENLAVAGGSTGGIFINPGAGVQGINDRVFLRTERGSIGSLTNNFVFRAPLIGVAAPNGDAYLKSVNPLFLGPAPELAGAAASVGGVLHLAGVLANNIGVRGTLSGSGAVTAGELYFADGPGVIYSDSPNAAGSLMINVGKLSGNGGRDVAISSLAKVTTSLVVGASGINLSGVFTIGGSNISSAAQAIVTSQGDALVRHLNVLGNASGASFALNGSTGLLRALPPGPGTSAIIVSGGAGNGAPALVTAKSIVLGTLTSGYEVDLAVRGGRGANSPAEVRTVAGDINIYRGRDIVIGQISGNSGINSFSKISATAGHVNITDRVGFADTVRLIGSGAGSHSDITSQLGVNIATGGVNLLGGASISTSGPVNITTSSGTRLTGPSVVAASGDINIAGSLALAGGASSMALVSTSASIRANDTITFSTQASLGSHAVIYAGLNGADFSVARGFTQTSVANTGPSSTPQTGVIVPPTTVVPAAPLLPPPLFSLQQAVQSVADLNTLLLQNQPSPSGVGLNQSGSVVAITATETEKSEGTEIENAKELPLCPR